MSGRAGRRVLVLGADAALGRALVRGLLARSDVARVVAVDVVAPPPIDHTAARYARRRCDLSRPRSVRDLVARLARDEAIDAVLHAALRGPSVVRGAPARGDADVALVRTLLSTIERASSITRLVVVSHSDVYRRGPGMPAVFTPSHPLALTSDADGGTRALVEADLAACARVGLGRAAIAVVRLPRLWGEGPASRRRAWSLRALGHDPLTERLDLDAGAAVVIDALVKDAVGVVHGALGEALPRSDAARRESARDLAVPGPFVPLVGSILRALGHAVDGDRRAATWGGVLDDDEPPHP